MADPESDPSVSVSTEEVRVGKAFEADRFPVPAIAFQIESLAEDPVRIRLVDHIPESFSMEGVGFHPDYDSDNWTAYRDHRVAYERTIDPGESVLTVYGIRIDDTSEAEDFLGEPTIELTETDDDPDTGDVLGRETTRVVRDALSGDGDGDGDDGLSNLDSGSLLDDSDAAEDGAEGDSGDGDDDRSAAERDTDAADAHAERDTDAAESAPTPRDTADDLDAAMRDGDMDVTRVDVGDAEDAEDEGEDATPESVHSAAAAEALDPRDHPAAADESAGGDEDADAHADDTADRPAAATESVAAALAAEIRAGRVDDDDLSALREALDEASPTSVDARIGRLQSEVADLLAYRDALAGFLDENGTAEEALEEVSEELSDLTDRVEALDDSLSAAEADRADLRDEVADLADDVAAVSDRIETLDDDIDELDDRLDAVETFEDDIESLRSEIDDLQTFRDRLGDAFGAGSG
jgi:prefoldin subunit 5